MQQHQKNTLLALAKQSIAASLGQGPMPTMPDDPELQQLRAVFVTLTINKELRGCLGQMQASQPLWQAVSSMAIAAASQDLRFAPLTLAQLDDVELEISVLSPLKRVGNWQQIRLGTDGVMVKHGYRSGVFLPQVANQTGWDLPTFLSSLCYQKAGLPPNAWQNDDTELYVFEVEKFA